MMPDTEPASPGPPRRLIRSARGYFRLTHPVAVALVLVASAGFAVIACGGLPSFSVLARMLLAMLGGQVAIGAVNEIVDARDDAVAKPGKPIPAGEVTLAGASVMAVAGLAVMLTFGSTLGPLAFALLLIGTSAGLSYDLWLKRTRWSWLPYLVALPLLPIWAFATVGRPAPSLLLLYPMGALGAAGVHLAQALPDVAGDRATGLSTVTSQLGTTPTFVLAWAATISAPAIALIAGRMLHIAGGEKAMGAALGYALVCAAINAAVMRWRPRLGERACFPLAASSLLISGLAWAYLATT